MALHAKTCKLQGLPCYLNKKGGFAMEELIKAVANVGFPIAVAAYLLIRIEGKIDKLTTSINQLATILSVKLTGNEDKRVV